MINQLLENHNNLIFISFIYNLNHKIALVEENILLDGLFV